MKLFYGHSSATHCTLVDKFAGDTERSHMQQTVHKTCAKVSLSQVNFTRAMESSDSDDSLTESIFVSKRELMDLI